MLPVDQTLHIADVLNQYYYGMPLFMKQKKCLTETNVFCKKSDKFVKASLIVCFNIQ